MNCNFMTQIMCHSFNPCDTSTMCCGIFICYSWSAYAHASDQETRNRSNQVVNKTIFNFWANTGGCWQGGGGVLKEANIWYES